MAWAPIEGLWRLPFGLFWRKNVAPCGYFSPLWLDRMSRRSRPSPIPLPVFSRRHHCRTRDLFAPVRRSCRPELNAGPPKRHASRHRATPDLQGATPLPPPANPNAGFASKPRSQKTKTGIGIGSGNLYGDGGYGCAIFCCARKARPASRHPSGRF